MEIEVQLTSEPIAEKISPPFSGVSGAWAEFRGIVRGEENGAKISALEYEAYPGMAEREICRLVQEMSEHHPCFAAKIIHRIGVIPVGEAAIYIGIAAKHRAEAFALLAKFMDRLKQDVPIWKRRGLPIHNSEATIQKAKTANRQSPIQLDDALAKIESCLQTLPPVRVPIAESFGRILRETVCATEDSPDCDRSTRDGYAVLRDDGSEIYSVVDTLHAADWKPRQLKTGEAVRVATGATVPCANLRVVMQEDVERVGDQIKILRHERTLNLRKRGEEWRKGDVVLAAGKKLDAGSLALLAAVGCTQPSVSPKLRVAHFTTGDEIIPADQTPKPGQVRDSNSILIRALLEKFGCSVTHRHLPEDFERAKTDFSTFGFPLSAFDLVLVSGGASVGEKDFTRPLLKWLGYEIEFNRVNIRPGAPLIFGTNGNRVAFGLPGNPLSHFVCFHMFVAAALARLMGSAPPDFLPGRLAVDLADAASSRETLWPAQRDAVGLHPLPWSSSGDVACLAQTDALLRVPANSASLAAGTEVKFLQV